MNFGLPEQFKEYTKNKYVEFIDNLITIAYLLIFFAICIVFYFGTPYSLHFIAIGIIVSFCYFCFTHIQTKELATRNFLYYLYLIFKSIYSTFRVLLISIFPVLLLQFFLKVDLDLSFMNNISSYLNLSSFVLKLEYAIALSSNYISFSKLREPLLAGIVILSMSGIIFGMISERFGWLWLKSMKILGVINVLIFLSGFTFYGTDFLNAQSNDWRAQRIQNYMDREKTLNNLITENYMLVTIEKNPLLKSKYIKLLSSISLGISAYSVLPETVREAILSQRQKHFAFLEETSDKMANTSLTGRQHKVISRELPVSSLRRHNDEISDAIKVVSTRNRALRNSFTESVSTAAAALAPDVPNDVMRLAIEESFSALGEANVDFVIERGGKKMRPFALYAYLNLSEPQLKRIKYPTNEAAYELILNSESIDVPLIEKKAAVRRIRALKVPKHTRSWLSDFSRKIGKYL